MKVLVMLRLLLYPDILENSVHLAAMPRRERIFTSSKYN